MSAKNWISPQVQAMQSYKVAQLPVQALKLDAMELPTDLPDALKKQWADKLQTVALNRYPLAHNQALETALRQRFAIDDAYGLMIGNGSDELIQIIVMSMLRPEAVVLAPMPTFVMYEHIARILNIEFVGVPLNPADFSLDMPAMLTAIAKHNPAVVFLANPNNPTGNALARPDIEEIVTACRGLVVLDEAYAPFTDAQASDLIDKHDNLVVMRTISKIGFAGLRFGYMYGRSAWLDAFDKVRPPYNVNVLTQASVEFVLAHYDVVQAQSEEIISERKRVLTALQALTGVEVWASQANFILLRLADGNAMHQALQAQGIWVRNVDTMHPSLRNCLRLTISNKKENNHFLQVFKQLLTI